MMVKFLTTKLVMVRFKEQKKQKKHKNQNPFLSYYFKNNSLQNFKNIKDQIFLFQKN